jgi:hypothetical protein
MKRSFAAQPDELFAAKEVEQDSPRLAWRKRHCILAKKSKLLPWAAWFARDSEIGDIPPDDPRRVGHGESEWEAIVDLAIKHGVKLWNEE